jgi:hypothetical protein
VSLLPHPPSLGRVQMLAVGFPVGAGLLPVMSPTPLLSPVGGPDPRAAGSLATRPPPGSHHSGEDAAPSGALPTAKKAVTEGDGVLGGR